MQRGSWTTTTGVLSTPLRAAPINKAEHLSRHPLLERPNAKAGVGQSPSAHKQRRNHAGKAVSACHSLDR